MTNHVRSYISRSEAFLCWINTKFYHKSKIFWSQNMHFFISQDSKTPRPVSSKSQDLKQQLSRHTIWCICSDSGCSFHCLPKSEEKIHTCIWQAYKMFGSQSRNNFWMGAAWKDVAININNVNVSKEYKSKILYVCLFSFLCFFFLLIFVSVVLFLVFDVRYVYIL